MRDQIHSGHNCAKFLRKSALLFNINFFINYTDILVLLNKQDIPSATPAQEIIDLVKQRTNVTERDHLFMVNIMLLSDVDIFRNYVYDGLRYYGYILIHV